MKNLKTYEEYKINEAKYFNKQLYDTLISKICDVLETNVRIDRLKIIKNSREYRCYTDSYKYIYTKSDYIKKERDENDPFGEDEELNQNETLEIVAKRITTKILRRKLKEFIIYPNYSISINGEDIRVSDYLIKRFIYIMENANKIKKREDEIYRKRKKAQEDLEKREKWMKILT